MIKVVTATPLDDTVVELVFSDGASGAFDLAPLIARDTELTRALNDAAFRARCYVEMGALCWPNGLELSGGSLWQKLAEAGLLRKPSQVA